jgi:predicted ester cyclase
MIRTLAIVLIVVASASQRLLTFAAGTNIDTTAIRHFYAAINAALASGNLSDINTMIAAQYSDPLNPGVKGVLAFDAVLLNLRQTFPNLKFDVKDALVDGNQAVVHTTVTGTPAGNLVALIPSDKNVSFDEIDWMVFDSDNKVLSLTMANNLLFSLGKQGTNQNNASSDGTQSNGNNAQTATTPTALPNASTGSNAAQAATAVGNQ